MPQQDELFQLIGSLTASEKRYFKVNASKSGDGKANYLRLFEAMDAMGEYDEAQLKRKHAKEPFVKYLSAEKKHLREQIMRAMRLYRTENSVDNRIYELLQDETFYRDKGLNDLREKCLLKAKEIATEFERYHLLQEILERQIGFVEEFSEKKLTQPVALLIAELEQLTREEAVYLELWTKNKEIFSQYRSGADHKNPEVLARMNTIIEAVENHRPHLGHSFRLNRTYQIAKSNYYNFVRDAEKSFAHTEQEYALFQKHPKLKEEYAINYRICLANLVSRAQSAKRNDRFLEAIAELKSLPATSFNDEGEVFQNVYFLEHLFYMNQGDFDKAEALVPAIEAGLDKYAQKINKARLLSFQFNIMIMYFLMHRFKEAAKWADVILEDKSEIKQGISTVTRILLPIIHFELGHHDIVENLTRSAYRYLLAKERLHSFERLMVNYLGEMPFSSDNVEFIDKLRTFNNKLKEIFESPEPLTYGMEEIGIWVKAKLHSDTMINVLKSTVSVPR